jgi:hypothetical protein
MHMVPYILIYCYLIKLYKENKPTLEFVQS